MAHSRVFATLVLLVILTSHNSISLASNGINYVRNACRVTRYPELCIRSLSSFSGVGKRNLHWCARAAVSVTLAEAERVRPDLWRLNRSAQMEERVCGALSNCVQYFQHMIDQLHNSLSELRMLNQRAFASQIINAEARVSTALHLEDTCLNGFSGCKGAGIGKLRNKVVKVKRFTTNALALINKLEHRGGWSTRNSWKTASSINSNVHAVIVGKGRLWIALITLLSSQDVWFMKLWSCIWIMIYKVKAPPVKTLKPNQTDLHFEFYWNVLHSSPTLTSGLCSI